MGSELRGSPEAPCSQPVEMEKVDVESQGGVGSRRGAGECKVGERGHREARQGGEGWGRRGVQKTQGWTG